MLIKGVHQKNAIFATVLDKGFKFQLNVCNRCHDLLVMSVKLRNIAFLNINVADNRCIITGISKNVVINLMQNIDLSEKALHCNI